MQDTKKQHYTWQELSPIREMDVSYDEKGHSYARLIPRDNLAEGSLSNLPAMLHRYGLSGAYADIHEGKSVLVVPNVKDAKRLVTVLQNAELTQGDASVTQSQPPKLSLREKIDKDSLKLSGSIGLVGHASLAVSGALQGHWGQLAAGPLGASTAAIVARYGNGRASVDVEEILHHVDRFFREEGLDFKPLDIPEAKKNILQKLESAVSKHPLPIAYTIGSLGSLGLINSGVKELRNSKGKDGKSKLAVGLATIIGNMAVVLVPETPKEKEGKEQQKTSDQPGTDQSGPDKPGKLGAAASGAGDLLRHPNKIPSAVKSFVAKSPLLFMSIFNAIDNVLYFLMAKDEWSKMKRWSKENPDKIKEAKVQANTLINTKPTLEGISEHARELTQVSNNIKKLDEELKLAKSVAGKAVPWLTMVTAVSFAAATIMTSISSKIRDVSESDKETHSRLYAALAKLVVQQDPHLREEMLVRLGTFLREDLKHGGISSEDLINEVRERVAMMKKSPFIAQGVEEHNAQAKDVTHLAALDQSRQLAPATTR